MFCVPCTRSIYKSKSLSDKNDSHNPSNSFDTLLFRFLEEVSRIASSDPPVPTKPPIVFENDDKAAKANGITLAACGFDFQKLINDNPNSTLGYGSEFRPVEQLEPLLGRHSNFTNLSQVLKFGMSYVLSSELDTITKSTELEKLLQRGNHKSAQEFPDRVTERLAKDVKHVFVIPVPTSIITSIPNTAVHPPGLARQWTIDAEGQRLEKFRLTQDLSFSSTKSGPPVSINSRIDMEAYMKMIYGWCLPRILHYIVALRLKFPSQIIFICKYDYSDAYRRVAHSALAAVQTISVHDGRACISVRLTFGGRPNPPTWCTFSEIATDLANEISQCKEWDPSTLHSPAQPVAPDPRRLPGTMTLGQGRKLAVQIPIDDERPGRVDDFIDDLINVFVDTPTNCRIQPHVVPPGNTHHQQTSRGRRLRTDNPSPPAVADQVARGREPRRDPDSLGVEDQHPPSDNQPARRQVHSLEYRPRKNPWPKVLLLPRAGRTSRASQPHLVRLPGDSPLPGQDSRRPITSPTQEASGPSLRRGKGGPTTVERNPDKGARGNPDEPYRYARTRQGLLVGCVSLWPRGLQYFGPCLATKVTQGPPLRGHPGINNDLLEFIAMVVNVWLECLDAPANEQPCILAIGDSTSAIGCLFKTFKLGATPGGEHNAHLFVTRHVVTVLMDNSCCIASQNIKGDMNVVADLLSFSGTSERGKPHLLAYD